MTFIFDFPLDVFKVTFNFSEIDKKMSKIAPVVLSVFEGPGQDLVAIWLEIRKQSSSYLMIVRCLNQGKEVQEKFLRNRG